jgi:uncharacterized tellurite resistance protein B-like protein
MLVDKPAHQQLLSAVLYICLCVRAMQDMCEVSMQCKLNIAEQQHQYKQDELQAVITELQQVQQDTIPFLYAICLLEYAF